MRRWLLAGALATLPAAADFTAGDLLGTVTDVHGNRLAAADVTLSGSSGTLRAETDADGRFRLSDLPPGNYTIEVESDGFSKAIYNPVNVRIGRVTHVEVRLAPSIEDTIVVTSEPPGVRADDDPATVRRRAVDLGGLPSGADPFATAAELPGVTVERPGPLGRGPLAGPGAAPDATRWSVDGVDVSDPRTGRSASFVTDLDLLAAVEVGAGGNDVAVSTSGLRLDLVTRRGSDAARFAVHGSRTDRDWQSQPADAEADVSLIDGATDLGGDVSGRLVRDRLWGWAGYQHQQVDRRAVGGLPESSRVDSYALKLDALPFSGNSLDLAFHHGDRRREGVGAGPDRSFQATQRELEPSRMWRLGDVQVFGADLLLSGRLARVESDSSLLPEGEDEGPVLGPDGVWQGSYGTFEYGHRSDLGTLELVAHRKTGSVQHELRTGASRRDSEIRSAEHWGAAGYQHIAGANFGTPFDVLRVLRRSELEIEQGQSAFWAQETARWRGFTLDLGVRFDDQSGRVASARADASPLVPDLLPAVDLEEQPTAFRWSSLSPRFALAWSPGREGRTVLRLGYSTFAAELDPELVSLTNPVTSELLLGVDAGVEDPQRGQLSVLQGVNYQPGSETSVHRLDGRLSPERTSELRLAVDHRFRNGLEVGVDQLERTVSNVLEAAHLVIEGGKVRLAEARDYELDFVHTGLLPDGSPWSVPVYRLRPELADAGGAYIRNGDRSQRYQATSLRFSRHLRHGFMLRGHVTWSDWRWHVGDDFRRADDPTDTAPGAVGPAGIAAADGDGEVVIPSSADGIFLESRWAWNLLALAQVAPNRRWGFDLGLHLHGRQGYPIPYSVAVVGSDGLLRTVEPTEPDRFRLADLYTVDLRLEKELDIHGFRATVSLDGFNLLDSGSVISRETRLGTPLGGTVRETLAPRVFRLGVRLALD